MLLFYFIFIGHFLHYKEHPIDSFFYYYTLPLKKGKPNRYVFGFYPYWRGNRYHAIHWELLSALSFFCIELSSTGKVKKTNGWPEEWKEMANCARNTDTELFLTFTCFSASEIHEILTSSKDTCINTIVSISEDCDGVVIDFEFPYTTDREIFSDFIVELSWKIHTKNKKIAVCLPAINWNERFDVECLCNSVDFLILMTYDYHYSYSEYTGPVAPFENEEFCVKKSMDYYQARCNKEKLLLGIPYYGYEWGCKDSLPYSKTKTPGKAYTYSYITNEKLNQYEKLWYEPTKNPWYRYIDANWYQGWYEDSVSIRYKYDELINRGWKGISIWALSYDYGREELWELIEEMFVNAGIADMTEKIFFEKEGIYDVTGRRVNKIYKGIYFIFLKNKKIKVIVY